jgi:type II secretory pathway pseudopilin PulG
VRIRAGVDSGRGHAAHAGGSLRAARAFTLVDVLVSLTIIALLITLLLPALTQVRESTRRVVCASNTRQHGLGFAMYVEDYKSFPVSAYEPTKDTPSRAPAPVQKMIIARTDAGNWDGLGVLFASGYLNAPQVFYCPSHRGSSPYSANADIWNYEYGQIVINYQYRGSAPAAAPTDGTAVVADGLRTKADYSHQVGSNILRNDYSVAWVPDRRGNIARALPDTEDDLAAAEKVSDAWEKIEEEAKKPSKE